MDNVFSRRIKEVRQHLNLTQRQVAERASIAVTSYSSYEKGGKTPPLDIAMRIASALDTSIDWLCGTDEGAEYVLPNTYAAVFAGILELTKYAHMDVSTQENAVQVSFTFGDELMCRFLSEWVQKNDLAHSGAIDANLYALWMNQQIHMLNRPFEKKDSLEQLS